MHTYLFFWEHPAKEVYVTGTFDDWSKSQKLEKVGSRFEKLVELPDINHRIYYKYVVDGVWVNDHTDPQESDPAGNINNVLPYEHINKDPNMIDPDAPHPAAAAAHSGLPGAFPETPAPQEQTFSVNPIPASTGIGNPITLAPGEPLPINTKSVNDSVTLDKESYENAGKSTAPQFSSTTGEEDSVSKTGIDSTPGAGTMIPESGLAMGLGSGLGADALAATNPHISSVGANSTTAQLAGQVPLEPRAGPQISSVGSTSTTAELAGQVPLEPRGVPEIVEKSQEEAHVSPEASANPEAVEEKSAVEEELLSKVPEASTTSDNSVSSKAAGYAAGIAGAASAAVAGTAAYFYSGQATKDAKAQLPESAQEKIDDLSKSANGTSSSGTAIAPTVPDTVQESIVESHQSPEAAANPEAVEEKSAVESELLKKIHPSTASGEPAPTASASTSATAPQATTSTGHSDAAIATGAGSAAAVGAGLAAIGSQKSSEPAATTSTTATKSTPAASEGLNAPASSQAQSSAATPSGSLAVPNTRSDSSTPGRETDRQPIDSRDVSPMTRGPNDTAAPIVTTGIASATTETKSTPPASTTTTPKKTPAPAVATSSTPASPATSSTTGSPAAGDKKKHRHSGFFHKLKERFEHRKDKH